MKNMVAFAVVISTVSFSFTTAQDAKISTTVDPVLETLKRPCDFDFASASLDEVAVAIEQQFKINVIVQTPAFEQIGMKDIRIAFRADRISLRSALLSMLERFDATFAIRWESLVLTTNEQAERYRRPAIYAVTDLVSVDPRDLKNLPNTRVHHESTMADFDSLINLIETSAAPDTWSSGTGPSSDSIGMTVGDTHMLIISQSESTHAEIERLLTGLRRRISGRKIEDTEQ